jgi:hypothetical protein
MAKKNIQAGNGKESLSLSIAEGVILSFDQLELRQRGEGRCRKIPFLIGETRAGTFLKF